jgi:hypothetical protein
MQLLKRLVVVKVALLALACAGCSQGIKVTRVVDNSPATGNPWNLPMTQFTITITRHITECGEKHIKGNVEVLVTPTTVVDDQQRYVLQSDGWWSTSDITSTLSPTGVSTGLNAQSTDATGTIISNAVATFGKTLVGAAAFGLMKKSLPAEQKRLCAPKVLAVVSELYPPDGGTKLRAKLDADIAALEQATARVAVYTAVAQADVAYKKELADALKEQASAQKAVTEGQKKLTSNLKLTTDTQVVSWPHRSDEFRRDVPFDLSAEVFANWTGLKRDTADQLADFNKVYGEEKKQFAVYLALYRPSPGGSWVAPQPPAPINLSVGIPVRLGQTGRLLLCSEEICPKEIPVGGTKDPKTKPSDQVVLQMGQMYVVPVTGGTFRSQTGVIALDANGLPTSIQVSEKAAAGVALTATAKDVASQLAALPAEVRAAELARVKAKTDQINAQIALANAQANLAVSDQTSDLAAQTALIKAQTDLAMAQVNAGLPVQTAALAAQTNFLNAQSALAAAQANTQTALLNAQIALVNAQANAAMVDQTSVLVAQATLINAQTALLNAAAALAKAQATVP